MKRKTVPVVIGILLIALVALAGCGSKTTTTPTTPKTHATTSGSTSTTTSDISIKNFAFSPSTLTVKPGTTVTWKNDDSTAHTVTANDNSFDSGQIQSGSTFQHTFPNAGTFDFHCSIHPNMTGKIIVSP